MPIEKSIKNISDRFSIKYIVPFGIELSALDKISTLNDIDPVILRKLIKTYKIIIIRNINVISKTALVKYAENIGPLLAWDFGVVMEMRTQKEPKNYLFTNGAVPFHWDGAFHKEPRYLLFHCIEAPLTGCGGETLFSSTHHIWLNASEDEKLDWATKILYYKTEKLAHYGGEIDISLVQKHPDTNETILRFAEPVPATMLNPVEITIDGMDSVTTQKWLDGIATRCYRSENCYEHIWKENDILLADNFSLIHARHAFKQFSPRFLRRIQIL